MPLTARTVLEATTFGERAAEAEEDELASYFVETREWNQISEGAVDIVYGAKGSGKSALYALLLQRKDEFLRRRILVVPAENLRGAHVFEELETDPAMDEDTFRRVWKAYCLVLTANAFREHNLTTQKSDYLVKILKDAGLLPQERGLRALLRSARDYVRGLIRFESIETEATLDPVTGAPIVRGKVTFREPTPDEKQQGFVLADDLLRLTDEALEELGYHLWIIMDRLDAQFDDSPELEGNALRALIRVHLDMHSHQRIRLKIFLRSDIWQRVSTPGFREGSHVVASTQLNWSPESLLNLLIRRALVSEPFVRYYDVDPIRVRNDSQAQLELFYECFPGHLHDGSRQPVTLTWMLTRTADGTGKSMPREIIDLVKQAREMQLRKLDMNLCLPEGKLLFHPSSIKAALATVSETRLHLTFYNEYPELRGFVEGLERERAEQTPQSLSALWEVTETEALRIAHLLVTAGFFRPPAVKSQPTFRVPFLYRSALAMTQGKAKAPDGGSRAGIRP